MATVTTERYTLIDAPGYCGDRVRVWKSYPTLGQARAAAKSGGVRIVTGCHKKDGDYVARAGVEDLISCGAWKVVR